MQYTCGMQGHIAPACSRRQNAQAISSSPSPAPSASSQLTIAYDGGSNFPSDGGSAWQLPSSSASTVSASNRAEAFYLPSHRPTPEMPL